MRLPRIGPSKAVRAALKCGFALDRSAGSHRVYLHPDGRRCVIPFHANQTLSPRVLSDLIEQLGLTVEEFLELV